MEKALRYEIEQAVPELKGEIYPTNAPVNKKKPYLVYYKHNSGRAKTLDGYIQGRFASYMFSIMAERYEDMKLISGKIEELLVSIIGTYIGKNKDMHVDDLTVNDVTEVYEHELKLERGIIDFTVFY